MREGESMKRWDRLQKLGDDQRISDNSLWLEAEWELLRENEVSDQTFTQDLLNKINREIVKRRAFDAYKVN